MINKWIAAGMVVFLAMTGIAAASTVDISKLTFFIGGGATDMSTVTIKDYSKICKAGCTNGPQTRFLTATTSDPNIQVRIHGTDPAGGSHDTGFCNDQDPATASCGKFTYGITKPGDTTTFTIEVKGTVDGTVTVTDNFGTTFVTSGDFAKKDFDAATRDVAIPEFPAIAFPVAGIIGMLFLFNSRRKK